LRKEKSVSNGVQTAPVLACGPISIGKLAIVLPMPLVYHGTIGRQLFSHRGRVLPIDRTSRNSNVVVPAGSLQIENGINVNARDGDRFLDGTNTRFRAETRLQRSAINA
jgi:hypothetical protein